MARNDGDDSPCGWSAESDKLEELVALYLGRLNDGEALDSDQILADHPDSGEEILRDLEAFVDMTGECATDQPLVTLGDYTLRRQIGRGGMGVVYEAWENSMDRAVALKVLPPGVAADDRAFSRFMREARSAGRLSHPNVVGIHAMGQVEKTPYYSMELVEGETLAQILTKLGEAEPDTDTPFGKKDCVEYFAKLGEAFAGVADGLQHAHSRGVVHRDMKPSNLILDPAGRLRILDFGLARLEGQEGLTLSCDFVGTPLYMSPEQARRKKIPVDHRTDVYSLGATMYEVLCGRPPFRGKDHADTLSQIIDRDPVEPRKVNPRVPQDLETIVLKCLRKEAGERYGIAEALTQDLRRSLRGDPIEAKPPGRWETLARKLQRQRRRFTVAALFVLLILAVGWFAWRGEWEAERRRVAEYPSQVVAAADVVRVGELAFRTPPGHAKGVEFVESYAPFMSVSDITTLGYHRLPAKVMAALGGLARISEDVPDRPEAPYYHARGLLVLGDEAAALEALSRSLERDGLFVPARVLLAELKSPGETLPAEGLPSTGWRGAWLAAHRALREERWEEGIEALDRLIVLSEEKEPYPGAAVEFHLWRGRARQEIGRLTAAIRDFSRARRRGLVEPVLRLGQAYCLRDFPGDRDEAEGVFRDLYSGCSSRGDRSEVALWIASAYRALRDDEKGLEWAERVEPEVLRLRLKTIFLIHQSRFLEAVEASGSALELGPRDSEAYKLRTLAIFYHLHHRGMPELNRWQAALIASAERAWQLDRGTVTARMLHGVVLVRQGKIEEAQRLCHEIIGQASRSPFGHILQALVYGNEERHEEAEREDREAVRLAPDFPIAHLMLGWRLMLRGKFREALGSIDEALRLEPRFLWAWTAKGRALGLLGEYEEAATAFRRAFEMQPYNPHRRFDYGLVLEKSGDVPGALAAYATSLCRVPPSFRASVYGRLLPLLRHAKGALPVRELGKLLQVLESTQASAHDDARRLETLALLRLHLAEHRDLGLARKYAAEAIEIGREDPGILATLEKVEQAVRQEKTGARR